MYRTTALGIGGERRKELCAVERSTVANAEPRKARPLLPKTVKNYSFFAVLGSRGNAQIKKIIKKPRNNNRYRAINIFTKVRIVYFC